MILMREDSKGNVMNVSRAGLIAFANSLLAPVAAAAKRRPAAKSHVKAAAKPAAKAVPIPAAKPMSRAARLRQAESEVLTSRPADPRLCWSDMRTK
jgi:hypothetical protein